MQDAAAYGPFINPCQCRINPVFCNNLSVYLYAVILHPLCNNSGKSLLQASGRTDRFRLSGYALSPFFSTVSAGSLSSG